ncbi:MAG: SDR family NAD(P)-dependent oxidoreductase [Gammaproteobacteria bacterium]
MGKNICIVGASGGIGRAMVDQLAKREDVTRVYALSRQLTAGHQAGVISLQIDLSVERSIDAAAQQIEVPLDGVIVTSGLLHHADGLRPEKSLGQIKADNMLEVLAINTVGPALVARYFSQHLRAGERTVFAALSARVGSIGDNRLGGWYSYRASKAALNMVLKTMAIEMRRKHPGVIVAGLHPGTVDTTLSKPFQRNVPEGKLFASDRAARQLLNVLDGLRPQDSGQVFDWAGQRIPE